MTLQNNAYSLDGKHHHYKFINWIMSLQWNKMVGQDQEWFIRIVLIRCVLVGWDILLLHHLRSSWKPKLYYLVSNWLCSWNLKQYKLMVIFNWWLDYLIPIPLWTWNFAYLWMIIELCCLLFNMFLLVWISRGYNLVASTTPNEHYVIQMDTFVPWNLLFY